MDDLIRRSDAIKAYNEAMNELVKEEMEEWGLVDFTECSFNTTDCKLIAQKIESIPAVEPSEYADIAYGIGVCQGKASVEPCKDAVSRQAVIDMLDGLSVDAERGFEFGTEEETFIGKYEAITNVSDLPSVTAETDIDDYMKGYDHGMADAWKIARIVFDSDATLYEAMDVVKCMKGADDEF